MEIQCIGTGSIGATQSSACTLLDREVLVDVPNGIVKRMKQLGCQVSDVKVVLITHLHGDHFFDLPFLLLEKYFHKAEGRTLVYGPVGTAQKTEDLFHLAIPNSNQYAEIKAAAAVEFVEFEEMEQVEVLEHVKVSAKEVQHGDFQPAYGFIVEKGKLKIGFSGDSRLCTAVEAIVQNCDASVLDMSLPAEGSSAHMGVQDIEKLCFMHPAQKIIATHMQNTARKVANQKKIENLIIPEDGEIVKIEEKER